MSFDSSSTPCGEPVKAEPVPEVKTVGEWPEPAATGARPAVQTAVD